MKKLVFLLLILSACEKDDLDICRDIDGNIYETVVIGAQTWMAEDLRVSRLNDGTPITENKDIWVGTKLYYCHAGNDSKSMDILYNWYTVSTDRLCPQGWKVPSDMDWKDLELSIGMQPEEVERVGWRGRDEGDKLKSSYSWEWGNNGSDLYGFNAIAVGYKYATNGNLEHRGEQVEYWSSTGDTDNRYAFRRGLIGASDQIYRNITLKNNGFSVRCIKNK